jgi:glycerol-3-phosphate dehydrogenase
MIHRDPDAVQGSSHDLIIVGGGIYGLTTALEAVARGLRPLLLEQADFGGATSASTLRILHGGLRHLQSLDLKRFRRSVEQRRWWLRTFPELVRPVPCLMPLTGRGLHRPSVLRAACMVNDLLSVDRNRSVTAERRIRSGATLDAEATIHLFPGCRTSDLVASTLWYDASMDRPHRLMMEILRWLVCGGGTALNYVSARDLLTERGRVCGVSAVDELTGAQLHLRTRAVVNAAGPWSRGIAHHFDRDRRALFEPSLAFNVLLRNQLPSSVAVAVSPPRPRAPTYFLRPHGTRTFAGTVHVPWRDEIVPDPAPTEGQLDSFLQELEAAIPGFAPRREDVLYITAGLLPSVGVGTDETRRHPLILDHGRDGGPRGLISVSGVKFTTAPAVARLVLDRVIASEGAKRSGTLPNWKRMEDVRPPIRATRTPAVLEDLGNEDSSRAVAQQMRALAREEAAVFVDDLVERRLDWALEVDDVETATRTLACILPDLPRRESKRSHR